MSVDFCADSVFGGFKAEARCGAGVVPFSTGLLSSGASTSGSADATAAAAFFFVFGGMPKVYRRGVLNCQQPNWSSIRQWCPNIEPALWLSLRPL